MKGLLRVREKTENKLPGLIGGVDWKVALCGGGGGKGTWRKQANSVTGHNWPGLVTGQDEIW